MSDFRDKPTRNIRITAAEHLARTVLWRKLAKFLPGYPNIKIEILVSSGFVDLAAEHFDAGVHPGDQISKDLIAVRIAPDPRPSPAFASARRGQG